jgi:predicted enzyme related to lactoylglutathione lyase
VKFGYAFVWVEDVEDTVRFYEEAFGVERHFIPDNGEFGLYAEMKTGETTLAIADEKEACTPFPDGYHENDPSLPPSAFQISFVTEDVEATYEHAMRSGAIEMSKPITQPWR